MEENNEFKEIAWQKECDETIKDMDNVILSSPTGSGKTTVFLKWALNKEQRPIYITAPIKSLSNQRYRELKAMGYTVGIETGDVKYLPKNCDFICCTQEIYTNKYTNENNATLIIDEFHYIFENSDRARAYIDGLINSKAKNICLCSATFGNTQKLENYIVNITNRHFYTYVNDKRLTKLVYKQSINGMDIKNALVVSFSQKNCETITKGLLRVRNKKEKVDIQYKQLNQLNFNKIKELVMEYNIDKLKLCNWQYLRFGIAMYYGSLIPYEKQFIEQLFEKRLIDTIVGTDALALGVNFPVEKVVFAQLTKQSDGIISKNLFEQLAGRAGRKKYFDIGKVYYCQEFATEHGDIRKIYTDLLEKDYEEIKISLQPLISKILKGQTTIKEEVEYICKNSIPTQNLNTISSIINDSIDYIKNYNISEKIKDEIYNRYKSNYLDAYFEEYYNNSSYCEDDYYYENYFYLRSHSNMYNENEIYAKFLESNEYKAFQKASKDYESLQERFNNEIHKAYFDEYSLELNCNIFLSILRGKDEYQIVSEQHLRNLNSLLQFRKYLTQLPKEYKKNISIKNIEDEINSIDNTVFNIQ